MDLISRNFKRDNANEESAENSTTKKPLHMSCQATQLL
jgi:hypothetical protein